MGRTFVLPELNVACGILSTEIIFVLHLQELKFWLRGRILDKITDS